MLKILIGPAGKIRSAGRNVVTRIGMAALFLTTTLATFGQTMRFTSATYSVDENAGSVRVVVTRLGNVNSAASVVFSTSDGSAQNGVDYVGRTGTLNFKTNEVQKTFDVVILDNDVTNATKTINVALSSAVGATLVSPSTATISILDDETGPFGLSAGQLNFSSAVYTVTDREGLVSGNNLPSYTGAMITITRSGGARGKISVDYSTVVDPLGGATTNVDYTPVSGRVTLSDYQMSTNFLVPIFKNDALQSDIRTGAFCQVTNDQGFIEYQCPNGLPFTVFLTNNGTFGYVQIYTNLVGPGGLSTNGTIISPTIWFGIQLSNPQLDANEDPAIRPPTLGATSSGVVGIVITDFWQLPDGSWSSGLGFGFGIERSYFRAPEQLVINGQRWYQILVCRDFTQPINQDVFCRYVVNASDFNPQGGNHQKRNFSLTPEADYALPFADYIPPGTQEWYDHRGVQNDGDAEVKWGANDIAPKTILIPIVEDSLVEFDEDLEVQLFRRTGDTYVIAPTPPPPFDTGSRPRFATLTIASDTHTNYTISSIPALGTVQLAGGEVPAGSVDRTFNKDNYFATLDKPFNPNPGANFQVLASDVQPDGKVVVGGSFTAFNTQPRRHIVRLNIDGQVDRGFSVGTGTDGDVTAVVNQPDGKILIGGEFTSYQNISRNGIARLNGDGSVDASFNVGTGPNKPVRAMALQDDGKILIGGDFTSVNGTNRNYVARLNANGSLDLSFDPGTGANARVEAIAVKTKPIVFDRNAFASDLIPERSDTYETGSTQGTITIDYDFQGSPDDLRVYYDGQLLQDTGLVAGQGSLTLTYAGNSTQITIRMNEGIPGELASWQYRLTIQPASDARPVIGGLFTSINGIPRSHIARLNLDGSVDATFAPGLGVEGETTDVKALVKHGNKVVAGGNFAAVNRFARNNIVRFNEDGNVDTTFDPGSGFDDTVYSIVMDPRGMPICGGQFTSFNTSRRVGLARLEHDGKLDTTFMDTAYNQFAGIPTERAVDAPNFVKTISFLRVNFTLTQTTQIITNDSGGNSITNTVTFTFPREEDQIFIGGSFPRVGGGFSRHDFLPRQNFAKIIGGETDGPGRVDFMFDDYSSDENGGTAFVLLKRDLGHLFPLTTTFNTFDLDQGPGTATEGFDYTFLQASPVWPRAGSTPARLTSDAFLGANNQLSFVSHQGSSLQSSNSFWTQIPPRLEVKIIDDFIQEGDEQFGMNLAVTPSFFSLGNVLIPSYPALGKSTAKMLIVDNDFSPGAIAFEKADYTVDENGRTALITLVRTNGAAGQVSVDYRTRPGGTATANLDYVPVSVGTVTFDAGQTNASFTISIIDDTTAELDETVFLSLVNPTKGATISQASAVLTIIDNDFAAGRLSFSSPTYVVNEDQGTATVTVKRAGGSTGTESVEVSTATVAAANGVPWIPAGSGVDFQPVQSLELRWTNNETASKTVTIPILNNGLVDGTRRFAVTLANAKVNGVLNSAAIGNQQSATVDIMDDDAFGNLRFSQPAYVVDENGTNATITVIRTGGVAGPLSVDYTVEPDLAIPGVDFVQIPPGTLQFASGQTAATISIPILDDSVVDGSKTIRVRLGNQTNNVSAGGGAGFNVPGALGTPSDVILTIIDNELENIPAGTLDVTFLAEGADDFVYAMALQDDGRLMIGGDFSSVNNVPRSRLARLNPDGTLDPSFFSGTGPNASVRAIAVQDDLRILIAGSFTNVSTTNRSYIARLTSSGQIDQTFDPGAGANNPVYALQIQSDGKILIGGDLSSYGPATRNGVARLNQNGTLDTTFDPGTGAAGAAFTVWALAEQLDGKILVAGDFTTFNGVNANHLVRLKPDGSVDATFNMSVGANGSVRALAVQPDGRILIGGLFTQVQGGSANRIARLNPDGSVDASFNTVTLFDPSKKGANGSVLGIAVQIDGRIMIVGDFSQYNGVTRHGLTRLNADGQNDPTINFGTGANGSISSVVVQPDRRIIIAGGFTEYDGQPRLRLARINGGSTKGAGRLEFARPSYTISETGTNVLITVRRLGGTASSVKVHFQTQDDVSVPVESRAVAGVDYQATSGDLVFADGETQATFRVAVLDDTTVEPDKVFDVVLSNPSGETGADQPTLGDQPSTRVVVTSNDSEVSFQVSSFTVGEGSPSGTATITIMRTGAISVPVSMIFYTKDGTATSGSDYVGTTNTVTFAVGDSQRSLAITILQDSLVEGNETVNLYLTNLTAGGVFKAGGDTARLTIVDDDFAPGEISFQRPTFSVREGNVTADVTVVRTNGLTGVVTVEYATSPVNATPDQDYSNVSGILTFNDGVAVQTIHVPIFDDDFVENNEVINVTLTNPRGGATLGLANATLTIIDDDLGSGSLDTAFDPGSGANGTIRAIELDANQRFVIGGDFTAFNNDTNRSRIARLLQTGALDSTFKTNNRPNNSIASLALYPPGDQRILIGGNFNTIQGTIENKVARLDANGGLDTSFQLPLGLNAQVTSIAIQPDGKVVIGGVFDQASAAARNHIARLNANGTVDISFDPGTGADKNVNVVTLQNDGKVLIGGEFGTVNGIGSGRIARLNSNGSVDTTFSVGAGFSRADGRPAIVYDILILPTGNILVAGDFTAYKGVPRTNIAELTVAGALDTTFASTPANINGAVRAVAVQNTDRASDSKLIIGGDFTVIDGTLRPRVARLEANGKFDPSFDPGDGANDSVLGVIVQPWDGRVVVAGAFTEFNNNTALHGIARMNNDKAFLPSATTEIRLTNVTIQGSDLSLSFTGDAGVNYVIEGSSNFTAWTTVKSIVGTGSLTTTTVPIDSAYRFFRVRAL